LGSSPIPLSAKSKALFASLAGLWLCAALAYCALREPFGFNYHIYKHFAVLANEGVDIFHQEGSLPNDTRDITVRYLDFTPAALALYRVLFFFSHRIYSLYQLLLAFASLGIVYQLYRLNHLNEFQWRCFFMVAVASPVWILVPIFEGEDKFIFALCPLLLGFVRWRFPGPMYIYLLGLFIGLNAFPLLFVPIAVIDTMRLLRQDPHARSLIPIATCLLVGVCLTLLYFPDSTVMFANRAGREAQAPFWFSLWRILPSSYNQYTHALALIGLCALAYVRFYQGKQSFLESLIFIEFSFLMTGNYINFDRVNTILVLPLVATQTKAFLKIYATVVFIIMHLMALFAVAHLFNNRIDSLFAVNVLIVNGCLVLYVSYLIYRSKGNALERQENLRHREPVGIDQG